MTADWPDDNPSAHRALAIYSQRVPIARGVTGLNSGSSSLAASGTVNLATSLPVDQPSFQMLIGLQEGSVTATIPFGKLRFLWKDIGSGFQVDPDWAILPGGSSAINFHYISGPCKADLLTIELDNLDPAQILFYDFGISAVSHVYERFRVQQVGQQAVPQFTLAGQNNQMAVLGSVGANVAASSTVDRLCSAWGGDAHINVDNTAGTVGIQVRLIDPGIIAGGTPLYGTSGVGSIWSDSVVAGASSHAKVPLPYGPVVIREINPSSTTAVQPTTTLLRLES